MGKLVVSGLKLLVPGFSLPRDVGLGKEMELATVQQYLSINDAIVQMRSITSIYLEPYYGENK